MATFQIPKKVFDGPCTAQKNQKMHICHNTTKWKELFSLKGTTFVYVLRSNWLNYWFDTFTSSVGLYSYLFYMALMVYLCYLYLFTYISVLLLYDVDGLFMLFVFIYLY